MIIYKQSELSKTIYCPYLPLLKTVGKKSISSILNSERFTLDFIPIEILEFITKEEMEIR